MQGKTVLVKIGLLTFYESLKISDEVLEINDERKRNILNFAPKWNS